MVMTRTFVEVALIRPGPVYKAGDDASQGSDNYRSRLLKFLVPDKIKGKLYKLYI